MTFPLVNGHATLARVFGSRHLELVEDAVQDALVKALQQWRLRNTGKTSRLVGRGGTQPGAQGPSAGLADLEAISSHPALRDYYLLPAVSAELWKQSGEIERAIEGYRAALACPCTEPERRFLQTQLDLISNQ
jgi:predicted RNA polymerase sigma factor